LYPFRGAIPDGGTAPAGLEIVNGEDSDSWTRTPAFDGSKTGKHITAYGYIDGDYIYLETGLPKSGIGSYTSGVMRVQFSYSWDLITTRLITIN